jgi:hypothetical protein
MRHTRLIALFNIATLIGCAGRPIRSGAIIDRYSSADCVPVKPEPWSDPFTRTWDHTLTLRGGGRVHVDGAQMPGGRIDVKYAIDGHQETAANSGDYIYPADVRFAPGKDLLYIKTSGAPAAFGEPQTWLFEYDLRQRRQTDRARVDPTVLPRECPETR